MNIIWDPQEIEKKSMEIIETYLQEYSGPPEERAVVKRVIHTTGDPGIISTLCFHPQAVGVGIRALREGRNVFSDVNMLKAGINAVKLGNWGGHVVCVIKQPEVEEAARNWGITRAAAALRFLGKKLDGAVLAIGNAPTALFEILDLIERGVCLPALIVGTPVGFVGAAESKDLLVKQDVVPYISLLGTRGGSPIAASIVNALLYFEKE
jgi:precorrin-8X/cobalt-precorrin-8 methylmutase